MEEELAKWEQKNHQDNKTTPQSSKDEDDCEEANSDDDESSDDSKPEGKITQDKWLAIHKYIWKTLTAKRTITGLPFPTKFKLEIEGLMLEMDRLKNASKAN